MSNAKETPRQKMISLMYLVLTCMLALNVSREVLQGFVNINESLETTNANFTNNTQKIMEAMDAAIKQGHHEFVPYYAKAKQVTRLSQNAFDYVDRLKKKIVQYTEDVKGADTLQLSEVEKLDDYDKPTYFLIGADETRPKDGSYSAKELRKTITALTDSLNKMLDEMKDKNGLKLPPGDYAVLKDKLRILRPTDNYKDKDGLPVSWEFKNFYNQPLAAVVTNLSKVQSDLRNIEGETINVFASASGKLAVKFNEMEARIVPVSKYVQAGSAYSADVFLSAASTDFKEDNLQFILGDMDTATGKIADGAKVLPIENGTGKINFPTSAIGQKDISGWIKFREGTGTYKYLKYNSEYVVANAAVAVSPDKMNVFYSGVENPVTISAAGVAPTELVVTIKGCNSTLKNSGNGKYIASVSGAGECTVTVSQKTATGIKQQGAPQVFRVKKFPNPTLRINGKNVIGNLDMKTADAKNISTLGLDLDNLDFKATFKVVEFLVTIGIPNVSVKSFKCFGNQLSDDAKKELARLKPTGKIYFEDIKVQTPDEIREFPMVKVSVK